MPDLGGLRRGIGDRAKQATQQISQAGLQQFENLSANVAGRPPADSSGQADEAASTADVTEEVNRLRALLERRRPPPGPVQGRWAIGIGDLLAEHPRMPNALRGLARTLDRYGGLAITPRTIEFDHDAIEWTSVTEIRTRNVVDYLFSDALDQQLDTLPLPWFPGRRKVLDALSKAMLTLLLAAAKQQLDQHGDIRIPAEVEYRGTVRRHRQLAPGVLAALVLADPAVNACVQATAGMYGIVVRPAGDAVLTTAGDRAGQLRSKLASIESRLAGGSRDATSAPGRPDYPAQAAEPPRPPADISAASPSGGVPAERYPLPDQGDTLVRLARDVGGERGAAVVAAEVDRVRRPDGTLVAADLPESRKPKDGPLHLLGSLLGMEAITVAAWAGLGFGMMQKRSASKQVEQLCRDRGLTAAVDWALANATNGQLHITVLRDSLDSILDGHMLNLDEGFFRSELARAFRKWR
ncbi:hypothetical protein MycrhDRAFT_5554 [Mycolicibacterium rhodesiae JS60]|nr:hypothetical protein MycrhDRAFT_5554 [Mycolicibacterium rhodesiae JS60]